VKEFEAFIDRLADTLGSPHETGFPFQYYPAPIISSDVIEECERNLRAKAPEALPLFLTFLTLLVHRAEPTAERVAQAAATIEPKDAPIVAAAAVAKVDYLASYDRRHLLAKRAEIEEAYGIVTATPDDIHREIQP
jgi:predicted nucleic acid-binding protein